jgi:hypothetical protein
LGIDYGPLGSRGRRPFSDAIGRWRGATFGKDRAIDLSGQAPAAQIEAQKKGDPTRSEALPASPLGDSHLERPPPHPLYDPIEQDLRRRIEQLAPGATDTQVAWALRVVAVATVERGHESTYRSIFGSQIAILKEINTQGSITIYQARQIYNTAAKAFPEIYQHYEFEPWGAFVIDNGLAALTEKEVKDTTPVVFTHAGKNFLIWITTQGLIEDKIG